MTVKRTFIVDDDPFWTALLTQMLTELGYSSILAFSSGKECLENLHLNPQQIFLDYQMEDMDGLEVLQQVKSYYPGINVVFCTGLEDLGVAVSAIESGSFDYLLKTNASLSEVSAITGQLKERMERTIFRA